MFGARGFAASILWNKAEYYKREQYWDRYSATLNQIALLQPHYVNVWDFQAHNLAYNIAVEFDGYRQRFEWIKKGIDYLVRGTKFNERQPILQWDLGIYTGQKIGVADEKVQYRELFRKDEEYHKQLKAEGLDLDQPEAKGYDGNPDHWLAGRLWFLKSYDLVDAGAYCKKAPHIFYSDAPKCQLRYSEAIESEGILDERAKFSWKRGSEWWREYGNRDVMTTWGHTIKMNGLDVANQSVKDLEAEFKQISHPHYQEMEAKLRAGLSEGERFSLDTPPDARTPEQQEIAYMAQAKLGINPLALAEQVPRDKRYKAIDIAKRLAEALEYVRHIDSYRNQVNFAYWDVRAIAEQNDETIKARSLLYSADKNLREAKLEEALKDYDAAWVVWARVFRKFPNLMIDDIADDLLKSIKRYKRALDGPLPDDFPLDDFYAFKEQYDKGGVNFELEKVLEKRSMQALATGQEQSTADIRQEQEKMQEGRKSPDASTPAPGTPDRTASPPEQGDPPGPPASATPDSLTPAGEKVEKQAESDSKENGDRPRPPPLEVPKEPGAGSP
jgi:hypothetical protein